jgi:fatty acyl-CoA reductase
VRFYTKADRAMACLNFYTVRQWRFISDNAIRLLDKLSANDRDTFYFDVRKINWQDYISAYVHGTRKYILKDETSKPDAVVALARFNFNFKFNQMFSN